MREPMLQVKIEPVLCQVRMARKEWLMEAGVVSNSNECSNPNTPLVLDARELEELDALTRKYEKLLEPGMLAKAGGKIGELIPEGAKAKAQEVRESVTEQQFYMAAMEVISRGFQELEAYAAKVTVSEKAIVSAANKIVGGDEIESISELCFLRSYEVAKVAGLQKAPNVGVAFVEGGATGALGFAGIPPNIVASLFCYFRAVQSIAMAYGFDVKNDSDELALASEVFTTALSPKSESKSELGGIIGKVMLISEAEAVKSTVKKGWSEMAARGGFCLLITQMRALAHKSAKKALEKAGKEGLENAMFRSVFEQIGKRLGQKTVQRAVPLVSAAIGALFDAGEMARVLSFADMFYRKRFILEKEERQNAYVEKREEGLATAKSMLVESGSNAK